MVEVVRTNFAPIFSDFQFFSAIRVPIVAPPIDNFENCSIRWKVLFSRKKTLQTLNRPTNADAMSIGRPVAKRGGGFRGFLERGTEKSGTMSLV